VQRALLKLTPARVEYGRRPWDNLENLFLGKVAAQFPP
jgi:hypothetical protein